MILFWLVTVALRVVSLVVCTNSSEIYVTFIYVTSTVSYWLSSSAKCKYFIMFSLSCGFSLIENVFFLETGKIIVPLQYLVFFY